MAEDKSNQAETGKEEDFSGWAMGSPETALEDEDEIESESESESDGQSETDADDKASSEAETAPRAATPNDEQPAESSYTEHDYLKGVSMVDDELEKLATRYENGEIEFGEYRKAERKLLDDRGTLQSAAATAKVERDRHERDWNAAASEFVAKPENRYFQVGQPLAGMMKETLERKFRAGEQRGKSHQQILDESAEEIRDGLRSFLGLDGSAPSAGTKAVDELKAQREKRLASATATPAKSGKPTESPNPYEGWAARW